MTRFSPNVHLSGKRIETGLAAVALLIIGLVIFGRYGGFDLSSIVPFNGETWTVPNTFAAVDNPFHASRAYLLLRDLEDGTFPRWIGNHQGGYPVEFYPLGLAWMDVGIWALLLGVVPIIAVHKLTVLLIFVLPSVGAWLLARGDRLTAWTAVLAIAFHVAVPGDWQHGGSTELIEWGLATNVAGAATAFVAFAALARWVLVGERRLAIVGTLAISAACFTNPRSMFAIAIGAVAILLVAGERQWIRREASIAAPISRMIVVALLGGALAAPVVIPLLRYGDIYYFVRYEQYASLARFWDASVTAVSLPVVILAMAGMVIGLFGTTGPVTRSASLALVLYVAMTAWLSSGGLAPHVVEQLETPRLMPFQRLLMVYLAAVFVIEVVRFLTRFLKNDLFNRAPAMASAVLAAAILGLAWGGAEAPVFKAPAPVFDYESVSTTGAPEFVSYRLALDEANRRAPEGTAVFVIGNELDSEGWWHEQLWAPTVTDRPLFYDDWLWYWQTRHAGPYSYQNGHFYPHPAEALNAEYFATHGISVVVVTSSPTGGIESSREVAARSGELSFLLTIGEWDIYAVNNVTPIVTDGTNLPMSITVDDQRISGTFADGTGDILIRRNWFPRWEATVNGAEVPIERTDDGYMRIVAPQGAVTVDLTYGTTGTDWAARIATVLGIIGIGGLMMFGNRIRVFRDPEPQKHHDDAPQGETSLSLINRAPVADTSHR